MTGLQWIFTFDNPEAIFDSLYEMNYKMVGVHLRPRFDNGKTMWLLDKAREAGYVYPEANNKGEFVNYFDQEAVDWWWENGVKARIGLEPTYLAVLATKPSCPTTTIKSVSANFIRQSMIGPPKRQKS